MAQKFLSDIHPTAGLKDSSGDLGSDGQVLSSTGAGTNWVQAGSGATVIYDDQFTATANQTVFTLSNTVDAENKTQVYIDGAYQAKAGYTVSGTTLTFDTGLDVSSKVEVITFATAIASNATAVIKLDEFVPGDAISNTSGQHFTLSQTVSDEKVTQVYINGVYQHKDTYSISGTTLQFSSAPPSGSDIEVITFDTVVAADGTLTATTFLGDLNGTINTATTATTQSAGNNSTKISTTAYTDAKVADAINNGTTAIAPSQNAVFDALALKSNLAGPTFTGTPAAPTASAGTNTTQLATTAFVTTGIANIVNSSPAALDTLSELATALGNDANFSATVTNSIATKLPLAGGTLTGDVTFSGDVLIGTNINSDIPLQVNKETAGSGTAIAFLRNTDAAGNGLVVDVTTPQNYVADFRIGNVSKMRITSGGDATFSGIVGINGSTTANVPLTATTSSGYEDVAYFKSAGTNIKARINLIPTGTGDGVVNATANDLVLQTGGADRLTISSGGDATFSGNVSLADTKYIQLNNTSTDWRLRADNAGRFVVQTSGGSEFFKISSGGEAIFTGTIKQSAATSLLTLNDSNSDSSGSTNIFQMTDYANNVLFKIAQISGGLNAEINQVLNGNLDFKTNNTSRLTISSGGLVGIGRTNPSSKLHLDGSNYNTASETQFTITDHGNNYNSGDTSCRIVMESRYWSGDDNVSTRSAITNIKDNGNGSSGSAMAFHTTNQGAGAYSEKMRISSGGTVQIYGTASANSLNIDHDSGNNVTMAIPFLNTSQDFVIRNSSAGVNLDYAATSWVSASDENIKENITSLDNVLDKIKNIRCVNYNLKDEEIYKKRLGFIAQDFQENFEEVTSINNNDVLGLRYTETIPILLKAIQEQQTIIEDLKARIETLEV